jgi:prepilin-type N-terminal cleavage/methylation domain-containing protein
MHVTLRDTFSVDRNRQFGTTLRVVNSRRGASCHIDKFRQGFTLIEVVAVIAMLSVLFAMSAVIIQFLLRSDQTVSQQAVLELTLLKLSQQFRDDVHAATTVGTDEPQPPDALELLGTAPTSIRVKYQVDGEKLIRELMEGDHAVNREVFRLPDCQIQFRTESMEAEQAKAGMESRFLVLSIDRWGLAITPQQQQGRGKRRLSVQAQLGRDQRVLAPLLLAPSKKRSAPDQPADAEKAAGETQP